MLSIKRKLLGNNFVRFFRGLAQENLFADRIIDLSDVSGDLDLWTHIAFMFAIFTPTPTVFLRGFLVERIKFIRDCLVVSEYGKHSREKFTPLLPREAPIVGAKWGLPHVLDNFRDEHFIFFFRVLLVENTVPGAANPNAAEAVFALVT